MLRLLKKASETAGMSTSRVVLEAGLRAMGATFLALEVFYALGSAYLAMFRSNVDAANHPPAVGRVAGAFILWFVSIQTYGLQPVALSLPFLFAYGSIAGVAILRATNKRPAGAARGVLG